MTKTFAVQVRYGDDIRFFSNVTGLTTAGQLKQIMSAALKVPMSRMGKVFIEDKINFPGGISRQFQIPFHSDATTFAEHRVWSHSAWTQPSFKIEKI